MNEFKERLQSLSMYNDSEEVVRTTMINYLLAEGLESIEEESTEDLLDMVEAIHEPVDEAPVAKSSANSPSSDEDDEVPVSKSKIKSKEKKAKVVAPAKKSTKQSAAKKTGRVWDGRASSEDMDLIKDFVGFFSDTNQFDIKLLKQGITVRVLGKAAKQPIVNFDLLRVKEVDGNQVIEGHLFMNRFSSPEDLIKVLEQSHGDIVEDKEIGMFRGECHPCIRFVKLEEAIAIAATDGAIHEESMKRALGIDKKQAENRKKLEEKMESTEPQSAEKKLKQPKKSKPVEIEVEVEATYEGEQEEVSLSDQIEAARSKKAVQDIAATLGVELKTDKLKDMKVELLATV